MGMADLQQLWQLGQQMQGRLQQLQTELASRTFEVQAGGGLVRVTADGRGTMRDVRIDAEAFAGAMPNCSPTWCSRRRRGAAARGRAGAGRNEEAADAAHRSGALSRG